MVLSYMPGVSCSASQLETNLPSVLVNAREGYVKESYNMDRQKEGEEAEVTLTCWFLFSHPPTWIATPTRSSLLIFLECVAIVGDANLEPWFVWC